MRYCSFCKKEEHSVIALVVSSLNSNVLICNECNSTITTQVDKYTKQKQKEDEYIRTLMIGTLRAAMMHEYGKKSEHEIAKIALAHAKAGLDVLKGVEQEQRELF